MSAHKQVLVNGWENLDRVLDEASFEGWELVTVLDESDGRSSAYRLFFKNGGARW